MLRDELLVCRHDVLAHFQRARHNIERHRAAADGLDDEVDLRVLFDLGKVRHKIGRKRAVRLFCPGEDGLEPNLLARVFFYHRGVIDQKIGHTAADHTKAGNCDLLHWILLLVVRHRENLAQRLMV